MMIEMREDRDGIFRERDQDDPLPYGLHEDPQEPYVAIIAPNIDKISAVTFDSRTVAGRRTRRGLAAFAASLAGGLVVIGLVIGVQWIMGLLGIE